MVDNQRPVRRGEQLAQANRACRRIPGIEVCRTILKNIILDDRTRRKLPAKFRDSLAPPHEIDFRQAKLLAPGQVFSGFSTQIGMSKSSVGHSVPL